jgi:nitroimidazol reductase NimA-like FMN-containing flavoprotein (pyridoxamine 5'-phosphate oxidase superfamily)
MSTGEIRALLLRVGFGHLGCSIDGHPYVVPMHFAYDSEQLYFFTTEGTKTSYIAGNSKVCFQVEEITDPVYWRSVMVIGRAERITKESEMLEALRLIRERNPALSPALNETKIGSWKRSSLPAVYRIRPDVYHGRKTI